jgi:hypothetical protein
MARRWREDELRLQKIFAGAPLQQEFSDATEMLRNLGSAIAYADSFSIAEKE